MKAPPGAGKTTLVPLALLECGWLAGQKIIMLEPRRLAARAALASASLMTSAKCSRAPPPPEAMTGMVTTWVMARVSGISKPALVPSASMLVSTISPAPRPWPE